MSFTYINVPQLTIYKCSAVGLFPNKTKQVVPISDANEEILVDYLNYLDSLEQTGQHFLGPHFCFHHPGAGYALHLSEDCPPGHFFLYQAKCIFEGDRLDKRKRETLGKQEHDDRDDLFDLVLHEDGRDEWTVILDPEEYSNFGRYASGVNPDALDSVNAFAFTVAAGGYYHVMLLFDEGGKAGDAVQYVYGGLKGENAYEAIQWQQPPTPQSSS